MQMRFLVIIFNYWNHVFNGFGIVRIISFTGRYTLVDDIGSRKFQYTCFPVFAVCHNCPIIIPVTTRKMIAVRIGKNTARCIGCFVVVTP